jgi:hypothetical protein
MTTPSLSAPFAALPFLILTLRLPFSVLVALHALLPALLLASLLVLLLVQRVMLPPVPLPATTVQSFSV